MTSRKLRITAFTLPVIVLTVGLALLLVGLREWTLGRRSWAWDHVPVRLVSLELGGSVAGGAQRVRAVYQYEAGGVSHQAHRVCFGMIGEQERAELALLSTNTAVTASVDPDDATHSVLLAGVRTGTRIITFSGALVIACACAIGVFLWRDPPWKVR